MTLIYKAVLRNRLSQLVSVSAYGKAEVEYHIDEWVSAPSWLARKGYYLLAFNAKAQAYRFCSTWADSAEVYVAEAEGEILPLPIQLYPSTVASGSANKKYNWGEWPTGTRMFERIKLLTRVA